MFKKISFFVLVLLLTVAIFSSTISAAEIELKWYQPEPEAHPWTYVGQQIVDEIYERSDGRINIEQYPAGALGTQAEAADMLRTGSLALLTSGPAILNSYQEDIQVFYLPYLFRDAEHAHKAFRLESVQKMFNETILEKSDIRTLDFWYFGTRTLTSNVLAEKPADLKGVKIRCMSFPVSKHVVNALGASATPIPFTELYMALQTGVVEGQENPIPTIYAQKFQEVQDYLILTNHAVHIGTIHVSEKIWQNKLNESDRKLIKEVFDEYRPVIDEEIKKYSDEKLVEMKDNGLKVIEPDLEAFKDHANEYIMDVYGDEWGELIREIKAIE